MSGSTQRRSTLRAESENNLQNSEGTGHDSESRATVDSDAERRATLAGKCDWTLVVAASRNGVIGRDDALPWHLRSDLQRFKRLTMGHCLLMGRKTYESIGRPLPGRQTIVLSTKGSGLFSSAHRRSTLRVESKVSPANSQGDHDSESPATLNAEKRPDPFEVVADLDSVSGLVEPGRRVMVVGGAEVYRTALDHCSTIWLTRVLADIDGDTYLPEIDWSQWQLKQVDAVKAGPNDDWPTEFQIWSRREPGT